MAKEKARGEELNAISKQTMAHAYSAMDYYFDHLKKTVAWAPSGGTEFGERVKACAEQNVAATQEFVRDLSYAKDIQDMFRIQMEFMRTQMDAFVEQANSLGEAYIKSASGQTNKPRPWGSTWPASISRTLAAIPTALSHATLTTSLFDAVTGWT
jgi:hypothetical protein